MQDALADFIDSGAIRLFCVDTVDQESWSDKEADKTCRAQVQEAYYHYIVDEALPFIQQKNGTRRKPVAAGFSLGGSHAAIVFSAVRSCSLGCWDARAAMTRLISGMTGATALFTITPRCIFWPICSKIVHTSACITRGRSPSALARADGKTWDAGQRPSYGIFSGKRASMAG